MTPSCEVHRLSFYTAYSQFYFEDPDVDSDTGAPDFWTKEAFRRGMAVGDGVIGIGTASYGRVRCFFQGSEAEPTLPHSPWQQIVEASIRITKGRYVILNCPDVSVQHEGRCAPGDYRLRAYGAFLDQAVDDPYGDEHFDFYWLVLWPALFGEPKSIKLYEATQAHADRQQPQQRDSRKVKLPRF